MARTLQRMRASQLLIGLGLAAGSFALCLAAAEGVLALRAAHEHRALLDAYRADTLRNDLCTEPSEDPRLIYRLAPDRCGANARGYRDADHSFAKPAGRFRIVVIGDSVAAASGVEWQQGFGFVLQQKLNERGSDAVEVVVLANTGYSTSQEIVVLEDQAFRYEPDLILWSYVLNDPAHPLFHNANGDLGRFHFQPRSHLLHYLRRKRFEWNEASLRDRCPSEYHAFLHCAYWEQVVADISSLAEIVRARSVATVVLIHPVFEADRSLAEYTLGDVHARLERLVVDSGLTAIDLRPAFAGADPDAIRQHRPWFDPWHPSAEGHRMLAEYLAAQLVERHLLERRAAGMRR